MTTGESTVPAYAKINLCFEVLGRRPDGLHDVVTVLQTISLADHLTFAPAPKLTLKCTGMPTTDDNLILRAARLLQQRTGRQSGGAIRCEKRIAVAAGLGGGSADAAATLRALNALWQCGLGQGDLEELAGELGADVPFFVRSGTALAGGTGRTLEPLPDAPSHWVVLAALSAGSDDKTRAMYSALVPADFTDGSATRAQAAAIRRGDLDATALSSAFTRLAIERWPGTRLALEMLAGTGAPAAVSGAGPAVFALYASGSAARAAEVQLRRAHLPVGCYSFTGAAIQPAQAAVAPTGV
ncbi:MAG: 4-diphosphocytidyl-2-C-methyl-D-erythritol kinase [Chloroflexota bacterium]|jgi:4-diphosphocytidyl-2-C-methyl-D-erythritol kinase|nr:4-diphosphocytidyl-2-C-methyl-D-erythritol kinase [Chloroflexota bacterium]